MRWSALIFLVAACPMPVSQDIDGFLAQVDVAAVRDSCSPRRMTGDGGVQFFAFQRSGKPVVSSGFAAFWGPGRPDAGAITPSARQDFVIDTPVKVEIGLDPNSRCGRLTYTWSSPASSDAPWAMQLLQTWSDIDLTCNTLSADVPAGECEAVRVFTFSPRSECALGCVRVRADNDVTCECG